MLVVSGQPIPTELPRDRLGGIGLLGTLLEGSSAAQAATIELPQGPAARDRPLFARVVVVAADGSGVLATSNALVLTRR